jgi:DNA-binding response OmpR family regulator
VSLQGERVLIIDDDRMVAAVVAKSLTARGYKVSACHESSRFDEYMEAERPDIVLLDVNMPPPDGFEILRRLKSREETAGVPVIMLTGRGDVEDRVLGLDTGADDYLPKPFNILELAARVRNLLRRTTKMGGEMMEARRTFGDLTIDFSSATVFREGKQVPLSRIEYALLAILARQPGVPLDKETLIKGIWGDTYIDDPFLLKSHVRYLRRKVERDPAHPEHIITIHGKGYQFR